MNVHIGGEAIRAVRVLSVEDDAADGEALRAALTCAARSRFDLTIATGTADAERLVREHRYDVALVALALTDPQSLAALEALRAAAPSVPIVVLASDEDHDFLLHDQVLRRGAQDVLCKADSDPARIWRSLRHAITRAKLIGAQARVLVEQNSDAILVVSHEGVIRFVNPAAENLFRRPRHELLGELFGFPIGTASDSELEIVSRGERRFAEMRIADIQWGGEPAFLTTVRDVTDRKQAEASLERFKCVVEHMPVGVIIVEWEDQRDVGAFRFTYWNEAARESPAWPSEGFLGRRVSEFPELVRAGLPEAYARVIRSGTIERFPELRYAGSEHVFRVSVVKLDDSRAVVLFEDVGEQLRTERQLRAAQRMEAVGRLAGGIAHDYNNILTVILTYGGFLKDEFKEGDPIREDVRAIVDAAQRASKLTSQLLAFSRRQVQDLAIVDINASVAEVTAMLQRLIGEDIALRTVLGEQLGLVKIDTSQVDQVLMNLAVNARDAMPDGGKLTIETSNVLLDEASADDNGAVAAGAYIMLLVTDTGSGMDEETLSHIFEPFYTTKDVDKGTGLGLSTVYGIVKQSGGHIRVRSAEGAGTSFEILFPQVEAERPIASEPPDDFELLEGGETVLLVEDEDLLRRAVSRVLGRGGYTVLEASHGGDALLISETHDGRIDLMVTDVVMPEMNGCELARRLASRHDDMRVIYMSGYADKDVVPERLREEGSFFVQKPFAPVRLMRVIRQVLDGQ